MKRLLLVLTASLYAAAQVTEPPLATLSGTVTSIDGQALAGAKVTLSGDPTFYGASPPPRSVGKSAIADGRGRYAIEGVLPGVYLLSADAQGYAKQAYGGKPGYFGSYDGRPLPLAAAPVEVAGNSPISGLDIRLTRSGTISGKVTTPVGYPVEAIPVYAVRWTYLDGARRLLEKGRAATDARGDFRIDGLAPGEYFVYAVPQAIGTRLPTYSPNALARSEAVAVVLDAGESASSDVVLREDWRVTVRGVVVGPQRDRPPAGATILLMQDPDTPMAGGLVGTPSPTPPPLRQSYMAIAHAGANGEFVMEGVVPGAHRLVAFGGASPFLNMSSEGSRIWQRPNSSQSPSPYEGSVGFVDLAVGNQGVEGVTILLRAGGEITSRIGMEGRSYQDWAREWMEGLSTPLPAAQRALMLSGVPEVTLIPEERVAAGGIFPGSPEGRGGLTQRVSFGRFFVAVSGINQLYYVKSIRLGGRDVTREPFDFSGGSVEMEITLGTDAGRLTGSVVDSDGKPVAGAPVSLWPVVPDRTQRNGGTVRVNARHDGSLVIPFVPPGEYYVIAFEDLPDPGLGQYAAFVSQFAAKGERVKVDPNQGTSASVKAIAVQEVDRTLATLR